MTQNNKEMNPDELKVGDRVIIFTYWNTRPEASGIVTALSEHFAEVEIGKTLFGTPITQWYSRKEKLEKILS